MKICVEEVAVAEDQEAVAGQAAAEARTAMLGSRAKFTGRPKSP